MNITELVYSISEYSNELQEKLKEVHCEFLNQIQVDAWRDPEDSNEEIDDIINEAPQVSHVTKHGYYETYAVLSIKDGIIRGLGKDEGCWGKIKEIELIYVRPDELVDIGAAYCSQIEVHK
jgi:hypothetical protein